MSPTAAMLILGHHQTTKSASQTPPHPVPLSDGGSGFRKFFVGWVSLVRVAGLAWPRVVSSPEIKVVDDEDDNACKLERRFKEAIEMGGW